MNVDDRRPILAAVTPFLTPFREHFLRRVSLEIPEYRLATLLTQDPRHGPWDVPQNPELGLVEFGRDTPWQHASPMHKSVPADWRAGGNLIRWIASRDVRAIWMVGYAYPSHARLISWSKRHRIPLLLWSDSNVLGDRASGLKHAIKRMVMSSLISRCAAILPCGVKGVEYYQRYGARRDRVFVCPAEPDYSLIDHADPELMASWAQRLGLTPDRRRIMCCARLVGLKRFDAAIDAFVRIADQRPEWDLLIVGDGPMRDPWQARVPAHLADRVKWAGFTHNPADTGALYRLSHLFVHPGDYEAWGVVILEAAAAGLPIIASNVVGAAYDVIVPGHNGDFVPPGDADAIADLLIRYTDPAVWNSASAASLLASRKLRTTSDPVAALRAALRACGATAD